MAAEQTNSILASASMVTRDVPAATQTLKELTTAASAANLAVGALRREPRIEIAVKTGRYVIESGVEGAREGSGYSRAITSSGNYAGVTTDRLRRMEQEIAANTSGSRSQAAEALRTLVASGEVQGHVLQQAATAVVQMNRVSGVSIKDAAENFSKLADEPLKASDELSRKRNYLTLEDRSQITTLEGKDKQAAAVVAQKAFAAAVNQRAPQEIEGMTFFDRWQMQFRELTELPRDFVRNVGRGSTEREKYERASTKLDNRLRRDGGAGLPMTETPEGLSGGYLRRPISPLWAQNAEDRREDDSRRSRWATLQGENAVRAKSALNAAPEVKEAGERSKTTTQAASASTDRAGVSARRPSTSGGSSAGVQRAESNGLKPCIEILCGCKAGTSAQKTPGDLKDQASKASEPQAAQGEQAQSASASGDEAQKTGLLEATRRATLSAREQTTALKEQNAVYGLSKDAVQALNIAQLERQISDLEATEQVIPGYVQALQERVKAERELHTLTRESDGLKAKEEKQKKETKEKKEEEDEEKKKTKKMSDDIGGVFKEGFVNLMEGGGNDAIDKIGKGLKKKLTQSLAEAFYDATLKDAVEGFSKWLGGTLKGASSGGAASTSGGGLLGGLGGILGGISSLFGGFSSSASVGLANIFGGSDPLGAAIGFAGWTPSAKGNVFASPGLHAYANSVVGRPTFFPFAHGIGLMGEAGPEAIMPLRRGSDGRLGVSAPMGASGSGSLHYAPTNVFNIDSRSDRGAVLADLDRALQVNNQGQMEQLKRLRVVPQ